LKQPKHTSSLLPVALLLWLVLAAWLLGGCRGETVDNEVAAVPPTSLPTATAVPPTLEPTLVPTPVPDPCLDCHIDKDRLIDTADPQEEVISENEGEG
jgi:hypothetical protein